MNNIDNNKEDIEMKKLLAKLWEETDYERINALLKEIEKLNERLDLHDRMLKVLLRGPHHPKLMKRIEELHKEIIEEREKRDDKCDI